MKKKIIIATIILMMLILNLFVASGIFTKDVIAVEGDVTDASATSRAMSFGQIVEGPDPGSYSYNLCGDWECFTTSGAPHYNPQNPGYQIFCSHHGTPADAYYYDITKAQAESCIGLEFNAHGSCATGRYEGLKSTTFFTATGSGTLEPWQAYIVSDEPIDAYSDLKNEALWGYNNSLYQESINYQDFDDQVRPKNGLDPKDATNHEKVLVAVDQPGGLYTVGPYKMTYTEGIYGNIAFGGVHEMTVVGFNREGTMVRDDIEIQKFVIDNQEKTPEYFEPESPLYVDETEQVYPESDQEFDVIFEDPNAGLAEDDPNRIVAYSIKVVFQYMQANGEKVDFQGWKYDPVTYYHRNYDYHDHRDSEGNITRSNCYYCEKIGIKDPVQKQPVMCADAIRTLYEQEFYLPGEGTPPPPDEQEDLFMNLGGYVWEDILEGKESLADGLRTDSDIKLKNIKVTLYTEDDEMAVVEQLEQDPDKEVWRHINSTLTDEEGYYQFNGLDPMKKYYVVFEYNGQTYLPTDYKRPEYNTEEWKKTSKATEDNGERSGFDSRFQEIGSSPKNYPSTDNLGSGQLVEGHNQSFSQIELMGYELNGSTYTKSGTQLIDGYEYDENGLQTDEYTEGVVSSQIRSFVESNQKFPSEEEMKGIYSQIAGGDTETWRKLQFIEDCKIKAYTGNLVQGGDKDLYPYYENGMFYINSTSNEVGRGAEISHDQSDKVVAGKTYKPIYDGQYFINLGLWRRQEFDAALRKDVYRATLKINNKTVVYKYDKRNTNSGDGEGTNVSSGSDNNTYWDINVRMSDYDAYYGMEYNRELYESDYLFNTPGGIAEGHPGNPLEIYVTYKITVRNQSMSIMGQIQEVVDYYDKEYTYRDDLSWVTYDNNTVNEDEFYNAMVSEDVGQISSAKATDSSDSSKYGAASESDIAGNEYNAVYIKGLSGKKLASGESAYIYLTFQVNKENNRVILDGGKYATTDTPKENIAEINGFMTYYKDGTSLPNGVSKSSSDIAGLLDRDSNPGNLESEDIQGENYEENFEDDTDRAPGLRVIIDEEAIRRANGVVWEDQRNETVGDSGNSSDAIIGDGIRQEGETGVQGVTVDLIEKCIDGTEWNWGNTTTAGNGGYDFSSFIPGDYIVRFQYGDTEATAVAGNSNVVSYNGQDFKSTTYQEGIDQNGPTDISENYYGYTDTASQNETGTFGYDIYASDSNSTNYSDAKDIWSRREAVNNYSTNNVTNHVAEVLASAYSGDSSLYGELIENTKMTAETGVIVVEFEYDRQQTEGPKDIANNSSNSSRDYVGDNQYNSNYTLNNIDLGLTERPKAQLEIDKSVANVKVTLANNTILFDINEAANNALWQDHKEYSIDEEKMNSNDGGIDFDGGEIGMYDEYYTDEAKHRYSFRDVIDTDIMRKADKGLIQLTMDEELMHGATIQVTYTVKITNVGEVDYVDGANKNFYYKGDTSGASVATTTANQVVDYVANNFQFNSTNATNTADGWTFIEDSNLLNSDLVNARLTEQLSQFNTIIETENFGEQALLPGQEISKTLILSQLITPENTDDDLTYNNMVEIVKTSNTAGRRMAYSVVGNQDPTLSDASEVDTSMAERIVILPPFGSGEILTYCAIALAVGAVLVVGIVLIRRKVLKGKNS